MQLARKLICLQANNAISNSKLRRRFLTLDPTDADTDTFELSFSSETPVARQYGDEVLSHAAGAVDLSRLNDSAPLLFNHNPDQLLGVVDSARVVGGKGRATVLSLIHI